MYLYSLFLSLDRLEGESTNMLNLEQLKILVAYKRDIYKVKHTSAKGILAEFKDDASKNLEFNSLNDLAKHLKGIVK